MHQHTPVHLILFLMVEMPKGIVNLYPFWNKICVVVVVVVVVLELSKSDNTFCKHEKTCLGCVSIL